MQDVLCEDCMNRGLTSLKEKTKPDTDTYLGRPCEKKGRKTVR